MAARPHRPGPAASRSHIPRPGRPLHHPGLTDPSRPQTPGPAAPFCPHLPVAQTPLFPQPEGCSGRCLGRRRFQGSPPTPGFGMNSAARRRNGQVDAGARPHHRELQRQGHSLHVSAAEPLPCPLLLSSCVPTFSVGLSTAVSCSPPAELSRRWLEQLLGDGPLLLPL